MNVSRWLTGNLLISKTTAFSKNKKNTFKKRKHLSKQSESFNIYRVLPSDVKFQGIHKMGEMPGKMSGYSCISEK